MEVAKAALIAEAERAYGSRETWSELRGADVLYYTDDAPEFEVFCVACGDSIPLSEMEYYWGSEIQAIPGGCQCPCHQTVRDRVACCSAGRAALEGGVAS